MRALAVGPGKEVSFLKRAILVVLVSLSLMTLAPPGSSSEPQRLIVGFHATVGEADGAFLSALGAESVHLVPNAPFAAVQVPAAGDFTARALADERVRYVEPDHPVYLEAHHPWPLGDPLDEHWGQQWGPQAVGAPAAWATTMGNREIVYAVVDTGVDYEHIDLRANIWLNLGELPGAIDADGNGYAGDVRGWNCAGNNNNPSDAGTHGTHVAGIAGAHANNHFGIAGVAQIQIMPLRALGGPVGIASAAAECIRYAADNGAHVIGMSWWAPDSITIREAITHAWQQGSLLTKSAGNQYGGGVTFPGYLDEVIATSALASADALASYSSIGADVEVAAPGSSIYSLAPGGLYRHGSGTSMAQPHTAGVAGLIWSVNPALTNAEVRQILTETADDLGEPGRDPRFGHGRINAEAAVAAALQTL